MIIDDYRSALNAYVNHMLIIILIRTNVRGKLKDGQQLNDISIGLSIY